MNANETTAETAPSPMHILPDDVDSPAFAEGLRLLRDGFADRTSFNHFVCDELARRGIPPNSANVLKYGRWGRSVAVAADVRSWFAHVARRLSARHANIPDVCQQAFNALGEQFWALALDHVGKPLQDELARTREAAAQELASLQARLEATCTARDRSEQRLQAQIRDLGEQLEALERRLQQAAEAAEQGRIALGHMQERAVAAEAALERARQDFESRLGALQAAAQADKVAREQTHAQSIELLKGSLKRLEEQIDQLRRDAALQIDKARQDTRAAEERWRQEQLRADAARTETESVREQLMQESVARARVLRDLEALQEKLTQTAQEEAEKAAKAACEDTLLDLAQSAAAAGIELRVPRTATRPQWIDERTWKSFAAVANAGQKISGASGPATK